MRPRSLPPLALLLVLGLAGCDELQPDDEFRFRVENVTFTFSFQGSAIEGSEIRVAAQGTENILDDPGFPPGFGADDVLQVRLVPGEAQLRLLNPVGVNIGVLDDVSLRLTAGGTTTEVASAEDIEAGTSMAGEVDLETSPVDISNIVTQGDFGATLDVSGDAGLPDGTYRAEARFDVEVTVPGI